MAKILTTRNAEITTVAVEVKALTISGKQVTLAVFRQIQEKQIIAWRDYTLNGVPWGWVNYHPDKCADQGEHRHVVWQNGSELFRATVYAPTASGWSLKTSWAGIFIEAAIAEGLRRQSPPEAFDQLGITKLDLFPYGDGPRPGSFVYGGVRFQGEVRGEFRKLYSDHRVASADVERMAAEIVEANGPAGTIAALKLPAAEYLAIWEALMQVGQLYIAAR